MRIRIQKYKKINKSVSNWVSCVWGSRLGTSNSCPVFSPCPCNCPSQSQQTHNLPCVCFPSWRVSRICEKKSSGARKAETHTAGDYSEASRGRCGPSSHSHQTWGWRRDRRDSSPCRRGPSGERGAENTPIRVNLRVISNVADAYKPLNLVIWLIHQPTHQTTFFNVI